MKFQQPELFTTFPTALSEQHLGSIWAASGQHPGSIRAASGQHLGSQKNFSVMIVFPAVFRFDEMSATKCSQQLIRPEMKPPLCVSSGRSKATH
jgi:hypothetical protein